MSAPRVYVTDNKGYDMKNATSYGEVMLLFPERPVDVFSTSKQAFLIRQRLSDAQAGDYLAVVGNMVLVLLTFGILMEKFGYVNVLLYDVRTAEYLPRVIPRHHLTTGGGGKNG